jgi:hypothetical protein
LLADSLPCDDSVFSCRISRTLPSRMISFRLDKFFRTEQAFGCPFLKPQNPQFDER